MTVLKPIVVKEGWMGERPLNARVYHYIRETFALCGRLGFYTGPLVPHIPGNPRGNEDCSACFKKAPKK